MKRFQFSLAQLILLVVGSAVLFSLPPLLWMFGALLLAPFLALGAVFFLVLGPVLIYWKCVHSIESRRPDRKLSDTAFSIGGTICTLAGIPVLVIAIWLLDRLLAMAD
jgi:hypothetical protein